jgi:hypothetical protein
MATRSASTRPCSRFAGSLSLRAPPGGGRARQREGARRTRDSLCTRRLLRRPDLHRSGRPERAGRRLVRGAAGSAARAPRTPRISVAEAFAQERERCCSRFPPIPSRPTNESRCQIGKTPVRALRPERLLGTPHPRAPHPDGVADPLGFASSMASRYWRPTRAATTAAPRSRIPDTRRTSSIISTGQCSTASPTVLTAAVPPIRDLLVQAAAARGYNSGDHGGARPARSLGTATELHAAVDEAIQRDVPHPNAVRLALERRREASAGRPSVVTAARAPASSATSSSRRTPRFL